MNIALITSTISPDPNVFALKLVNCEQRLADYKNAFSFYCQALKNGAFDKIVYVDNSEYDLSELKQIARNNNVESNVEFISYKSLVDVKNNNRFYLELNLIDHFIKNSQIIKKNKNATIWKITGRYLIKNIYDIVTKCNGYDLYLNYRNRPYKLLDFYLAGFTINSYEKIFSSNIHLYKGKDAGEIILREYLDELANSNLKILKRFPYIADIRGRRGFDGASYDKGKAVIKYHIRVILNKIFPFMWI